MYDEFGNMENEDQYTGKQTEPTPIKLEKEPLGYSEIPAEENLCAESVQEPEASEYEREASAQEEAVVQDTSESQNAPQAEITYEEAAQSKTVPEEAAQAETAHEEAAQSETVPEETIQNEEPEYSEFSPEGMNYSEPQTKQPDDSSVYHYRGNQLDGQYYHNGQYHRRENAGQNIPPRQETHTKKKKDGFGKKIAVCAGLAAVFGLVASAVFQATNYVGGMVNGTASTPQTEERVQLQTAPADSAPSAGSSGSVGTAVGSVDISAVAENAMPSIVAITSKGVEEVQSLFFGGTQYQETESSGSGVIVAKNDAELLIATNNHVVADAQELSVCFTVDTEDPKDAVVTAQVKGTDSDHDLAVVAVKISDISQDVQSKLKVAVMGDSDAVKVGTQVVAIGNALGYGQSLTVGYISALNREVTIDGISNNMLQTDAAINFGNSGGALLDTNGNLIGINSAKAADTGVEGMGYALPINTASPILDELMNRTTRAKVENSEELGFIGVDVRDVSEEARQIYNLPAGAFVYSVVEGAPAEASGIKKGDIITKLDGITITSRDELLSRMEYYKAGETIDVVVKTANGGEYEEHTVSVTLAKKSDFSDETDTGSTQQTPDYDQTDPNQTDPNQTDPNQGQNESPRQYDEGYDNRYDYGDGYSIQDFFDQFSW